ncbi:MAG: hypothetical protein ACRD3N_10755 [Terracidiphilus sp.]
MDPGDEGATAADWGAAAGIGIGASGGLLSRGTGLKLLANCSVGVGAGAEPGAAPSARVVSVCSIRVNSPGWAGCAWAAGAAGGAGTALGAAGAGASFFGWGASLFPRRDASKSSSETGLAGAAVVKIPVALDDAPAAGSFNPSEPGLSNGFSCAFMLDHPVSDTLIVG